MWRKRQDCDFLAQLNLTFKKKRKTLRTGKADENRVSSCVNSSKRRESQPAAMAILFAVVARGSTILAKHAWCGGNFLEVTEQILAKIPSENNKLTYSHGNYLFHYICQDRIIYLCITDDDFERSRAFTFLNEIKKRFQTTYGSRAQTALPYAMNSEFSSVLAAQLKYHSENKGSDQVAETQAQVDELKGIMVRNIDLVAQRGEKLELLIDKTENLVDSQESGSSNVYEEPQAHHHYCHSINCHTLHHCVSGLRGPLMAKLCTEVAVRTSLLHMCAQL
ncbi:vesicle-associated membrane protein 7 isoform X2 [Sceloporus undulatus]|uniref:vesicle-associated membrane protein 7 isoform X2 n=1 Tax=Sceloporus undulatus TaxID=8520 RepID=UPI001C4B0759|nr:vesicle-associated membrane protein 7 isoform X2 [Sceloporus undulatus]